MHQREIFLSEGAGRCLTTMDNLISAQRVEALQDTVCKFSDELQAESLESVFLDEPRRATAVRTHTNNSRRERVYS